VLKQKNLLKQIIVDIELLLLQKSDNMNEFNFTYKTDEEFQKAKERGYIESYNIVRINISDNKGFFNYPIHSEEEFNKVINFLETININYNIHPDIHSYDIQDYV
jgi:hypothetical protein